MITNKMYVFYGQSQSVHACYGGCQLQIGRAVYAVVVYEAQPADWVQNAD